MNRLWVGGLPARCRVSRGTAMTLLVNEIYHDRELSDGLIIMAADRSITLGGRRIASHRKVFEISHLNGGVGYFGLASPTTNKRHPFASWLPNLIRQSSQTQSL